ncbi:hypothetical protein CGRA01v4_14318 [Colletotrichum graminicola]|nr:hypothetical protein CGRA01v4_14318 [Colletotrichum graminicola]
MLNQRTQKHRRSQPGFFGFLCPTLVLWPDDPHPRTGLGSATSRILMPASFRMLTASLTTAVQLWYLILDGVIPSTQP